MLKNKILYRMHRCIVALETDQKRDLSTKTYPLYYFPSDLLKIPDHQCMFNCFDGVRFDLFTFLLSSGHILLNIISAQ